MAQKKINATTARAMLDGTWDQPSPSGRSRWLMREVAEYFGARTNAVSQALSRDQAMSARGAEHWARYLPWPVATADLRVEPGPAIILDVRAGRDEKLTVEQQNLLADWRRNLDELGAVLRYAPGQDRPWWLAPRTPEDGPHLYSLRAPIE